METTNEFFRKMKPANTAASHSLPLLRAKREERHVVAGANERRLYSQAKKNEV